jgi:hypothetical protein
VVDSSSSGAVLLQEVAERIIARYLMNTGKVDVQVISTFKTHSGRGVDLSYAWQGGRREIKVKADPYFGTDSAKIRDRALTFYRPDTGAYAFEAVANSATREPGWMLDSEADDLYYYYLTLSQEEDDVRALLAERDEVFFSEIAVERDDLLILPMAETRAWFARHADSYPPRPVMVGGASSWYRLIPRVDAQRQLEGVRIVGPIFSGVAS